MASLLRNIPWTKQQRDVRRLAPLVARINEFERQYQRLTENELRGKTEEFRQRVRDAAEGDLAQRLAGLRENVAQAIDDRERGQVLLRIRAVYESLLDPLLPEAFAVVKNACRRLLGATVEVSGHALAWDMVPFDVQLMGGIVLHHGKIAEMATGEGKTLVATLPLYLNALTGQNVHLVTVNDYLARRDSQWMGLVFQYLGLTVGCIQNQMNHAQRKIEYSRDVTYGTASEFGFDYLRDNGLAYSPEDQVQRGYYYAIVDEVDSILIDEARTPLIISGPAPASNEEYTRLKPRVEHLVLKQQRLCGELVQKVRDALEQKNVEAAQFGLYQLHHGMPKHKQLLHLEEDPDVRRLHEQVESMMLTDMRKEQARELREELYFTIDERGRDASLTEKGCAEMSPGDPDMYLLPDLVSAMAELDADRSLADAEKAARRLAINNGFAEKSDRIHAVDQLIRAYCLYEKDVEYVVQESQVLIVDEFTGRILPGRRWSDGLHQAIEAKEGVKIEGETQTLATITIQNYFRMYEKLAGMTGTAETEATEFRDIYKLDVVVIPTNRPVRRVDANDMVYKTQREKYKAVIEEIKDCHERGQPMLVGTASVDTSEILSRMLTRARIPHNVLNAKNHEREADIVRLAGQAGTVTIATNMAGRGTDIKLGQGVVHLDRAVIESQRKLDDRGDGRTLREILTETPCGLHVIGSERHEARRIDRQLRGRCARQGDPGSSRFYVSLEDDLMRLFGSERIAGIMTRMGLEEGQELEHRWLNRSIESAQKRVEQQNLSIRKRTLEYDDVMNRQRQIIYQIRGDVLRSLHPRETLYSFFFEDLIDRRLTAFREDKEEELGKLMAWAMEAFGLPLAQPEFLQGVLARQAAGKLGGDATPRTAEQTADALVAADGRRESASGALEPRTGAGVAAPASDKALRAVTEWLKDMRVDFDGDKIRRLGTDAAQIAAVVTERISRPGGESGRELVLDGEAVRRIVTGADFAACARDELLDRLRRFYEASLPPGVPEAQVNRLQRGLMLHFIDLHWQDYLRAMDALRQGVGLRAYGQQDPVTEYKREAYQMFGNLINGIKEEVASESFRHPPWSYRGEVFVATAAQRAVHDSVSLLGRGDAAARSVTTAGGRMVERIAENVLQEAPQSAATRHRDGPKVGRNDPCPCGSGKKYKKCCGA